MVTGLALLAGRKWPGLATVLALAFAFRSPLCPLSSALFPARVLHDVLLVAVAAPLLALARPTQSETGTGLPFLAASAALWL